jgi:hypothetical protein
MKKIVLSLLIVAAGNLFAQNTAKDFFTSKNMVWYGLNFTEAKMVGQFDQGMGAGTATPQALKTKWMSGWNGLVMKEPQNFKLKEAFHKDEVFYDIGPTEKMNQEMKTDDLMSYNTFTFKDPQAAVNNVVSKLTGGEKTEGLGVVFVVESFNKNMEEASVYVTIFDIKTKKVLITEKVVGKPMGVGLRNFWAGAIKAIIKQIDNEYYGKWKSKNK